MFQVLPTNNGDRVPESYQRQLSSRQGALRLGVTKHHHLIAALSLTEPDKRISQHPALQPSFRVGQRLHGLSWCLILTDGHPTQASASWKRAQL